MTFPGTPPASHSSGAAQAGTRHHPSSPIAPAGPSTSSSSGTRNSKLDHIIQNFYTKTVQVIVQARISADGDRQGKCSSISSATSATSSTSKSKMNKWFNIATQDAEFLREDLRFWRSRAILSIDQEAPPLILDIYLDLSDLTPSQSLLLASDRSRFNKVDLPYSATRILLERWTLSLSHPLPDSPVDLPNLYKRSIIFFRALYSFVRLLPGDELHRRFRRYGQQLNGLSLGYRLSASPVNEQAELSMDRSILDGDTRDMQTYEFSGVITPLGTFKLQVQYRKNCDFRVEDSERDLSARMMDLHEQFFTPTVDKHRQEQRPRSAVFYDEQEEASQHGVPRFTSSFRPPSAGSTNPREIVQQKQRRSSIGYRGSPTLGSPNIKDSRAAQQPNAIDTSAHVPLSIGSPFTKRLSAPQTSPFKTPSLSSSPQAEIMYSRGGEGLIGRPQPSLSDRVRSTTATMEGGSGRSKIEFSPSFDKLREQHTRSPSRSDLTRRWSRTSDHSSINLDAEDDTGLEDFIRFASSTHSLGMFSNRSNASQVMEGGNISPTSDTSMTASASGSASIHRSRRSLSRFHSLREAHNTLSDSMTSSVLARSVGGDRPSSPTAAGGLTSGVSLGSSASSSTGRSYLPVVPSPLHATENPAPEELVPAHNQHRNSDPSIGSGRAVHHHQRHHSLSQQQQQLRPGSSGGSNSFDRSPPAFSSYPKDRHHDELRRLCMHDDDGMLAGRATAEGSGGLARFRGSSLTSDDALPSPDAEIRRQESLSSLREHRTSIADDDDSLVFKMSELNGEGCSGSGSSSLFQQQGAAAALPFAATVQIEPSTVYSTTTTTTTRDYTQCLMVGGGGNSLGGGAGHVEQGTTQQQQQQTLRRIGSSTSLRQQQPSSMATVVEEEERSASSSSASEDIHPTTTTTTQP